MVRLSVVAPCFNEAEGLREFHRRTAAMCLGLGTSYEIVLINDGSTDGTWQLMRTLAGEDEHVVAVDLSRNHGHQLALTAGLSLCRGECVAVLDADLQDPPELVPAMLQRIEAGEGGADVVYGQRRQRAGETVFKRATAALFYRTIERLTDVPIPRDTGDFRVLSRRALNVLLQMPERHRFIRGMVSWIGFRQEPFLYDRDPRYAGQTKYTLGKMVRFATDAITAFSVKPLRLASLAGFAAAFVGGLLFLWALYSWLFLHAVPGWTTVMAGMAIFSSVQLIVMGIFGEYLGRLYEQSKGRPLFVIADVVRGSEPRRLDESNAGRESDKVTG